jgi:hypothetical protein
VLSIEENKLLVRRLVDEAVTQHDVDILDELASREFAEIAKRWVRPFQSAFPDFQMEIVELIAENDTVVAHFKCSGTIGVSGLGCRPRDTGSRTWTRSTSFTSGPAGWSRRSASRTT